MKFISEAAAQLFCKEGVLENLAKFTGKHLFQSLLFNKVAGPKPAALLKKRHSITGVFLRILRNFQEHFFGRTPPVAASVIYYLSKTNQL